MRVGDHDAFATLAAAAISRLDGAARLILHDPDQAKDAVQETLVRAWRTLRNPHRFDPWLHRLLVNSCLMGRDFPPPFEMELDPLDGGGTEAVPLSSSTATSSTAAFGALRPRPEPSSCCTTTWTFPCRRSP